MPYDGSMTTGELAGVLERNNPWLYVQSNGHRNASVYLSGRQLVGISRCGTLPPRSIIDTKGVIVCRGWKDVIAKLYASGHLRVSREMVRLMGRRAFQILDETRGSLLPQLDGIPGLRKDYPAMEKPEWLNKTDG